MTPVAPTLGLAVAASEPAGDRLVEVAVDAPGAGRRRVHLRPAGSAGRRRGWRGDPRRVRPAPGARRRPRACRVGSRRDPEADRRPGPGRRPAPAGPQPGTGGLDRRYVPGAAGGRGPGHAPARDPRAARARRRTPAGRGTDDGTRRSRRARPARRWPAGGPRPRRAGGPGGSPAPAPGAGRRRPARPRLDAPRRDWRAALRALGPSVGDRIGRSRDRSRQAGVRRAARSDLASSSCWPSWPPARSRVSLPRGSPAATGPRPWPASCGATSRRSRSASDRVVRSDPGRSARAADGRSRPT